MRELKGASIIWTSSLQLSSSSPRFSIYTTAFGVFLVATGFSVMGVELFNVLWEALFSTSLQLGNLTWWVGWSEKQLKNPGEKTFGRETCSALVDSWRSTLVVSSTFCLFSGVVGWIALDRFWWCQKTTIDKKVPWCLTWLNLRMQEDFPNR